MGYLMMIRVNFGLYYRGSQHMVSKRNKKIIPQLSSNTPSYLEHSLLLFVSPVIGRRENRDYFSGVVDSINYAWSFCRHPCSVTVHR